MANWLKELLDKLAKANDEAFKGRKPDCCDLNRNSSNAVKQDRK